MRQGALIGPIIIAIGLVVAALAFAVVGALLETADGSAALRLDRAEAALEQQREGLRRLSASLDETRKDMRRLEEEQALRAAAAPSAATVEVSLPELDFDQGALDDHAGEDGTGPMTEEMLLAKSRFNTGVTQPRNRVMLDLLGHPRDSYSSDCQPVTQPRLKALLETRQVGPIRVTLIRPALESLERIFARLAETEPEIHAALGTAGGLCARLIRGSQRSVSNHSWGTAIDLKLQGRLDGFGDGSTQFGLLLLAELFNEEGWFWGATYSREDSMHFEVGVETLERWKAEGKL